MYVDDQNLIKFLENITEIGSRDSNLFLLTRWKWWMSEEEGDTSRMGMLSVREKARMK